MNFIPTNLRILIIILFIKVFLISCNSNHKYQIPLDKNSNHKMSAMMVTSDLKKDEEINPKSINKNEKDAKNKKIIKDGNISFKTNDIYSSKRFIDNLLVKLNAYYQKEELNNTDLYISYNLKVRVPSNNFEILISLLENGNLEIENKNLHARDITTEYIDIEIRLANKRDYLKRYKELLSKASTVKDILAIEDSIRLLQEEIESQEGRLNYLQDQVSFSTLKIQLTKDKEYKYKPYLQIKFFERLKTSLTDGWISVVDFILWLISIWPYYILSFVILFFIRRFLKKRKKDINGE